MVAGGLAVALLTHARLAGAQPARRPVIGYLAIGTAETRAHYVAAFQRGLAEAGIAVGNDVEIEFRWAGESRDRFGPLADELVRRKVDVILAGSNWAAIAAMGATRSIPIVFAAGGDPIADGLVASYNRPGGNATGAVFMSTELSPKRLELLRELVPGGTVAMLFNLANADSRDAARVVSGLSQAASVLGLTLLPVPIEPTADIAKAVAEAKARGASALLVANDAAFNSLQERLPRLEVEHRLPAIYFNREFVAAGGLMSYGVDYANVYRLAGTYVARVIKGEKPADLPVMQPTRFEFVINLKTAKALDIEMPPLLLVRADEVIE